MKKIVILFIFSLCLKSYSQITLDFQLPITHLTAIHLTNSETMFSDYTLLMISNVPQQFKLFNLDGTLYNTIVLPPAPHDSCGLYYIGFITRTLFDNDPSNLEYIIDYYWDSIPSFGIWKHQVRVLREDGTLLLDEPNGHFYDITSTEEGAKLTLTYYYANGYFTATKVFNLPGELPTSINNKINLECSSPKLYPNPNNGSFYVKFSSTHGDFGTIDLYSTTGRLLNTYKATENISHIQNMNLLDGLYLLNVKTAKSNSILKMIINK